MVAEDVEGGGDVAWGDRLVDMVIADSTEQGAGDLTVAAFLVVTHQGQQVVVVVAGEGEVAVVVADEVAQQVNVIAGEFEDAGLFGSKLFVAGAFGDMVMSGAP